ncbi:MAG: hypothetical protein QW076_03585, partial [Candidatus Anstonellales archaeon]
MVYLPIVKYSNYLECYGAYDSLAHYSFALGLLINGFIQQSGSIYSNYYNYHAGNGLLPVFLSIVMAMPLGYSMLVILIISYFVYIANLLSLIKKWWVDTEIESYSSFLIISMLLSFLFVWCYYLGITISYAFISIILYFLVKWIILNKGKMEKNSYTIFIIVYFGLTLTHLSSASIITLYMLILVIFLILFRKTLIHKKHIKFLI